MCYAKPDVTNPFLCLLLHSYINPHGQKTQSERERDEHYCILAAAHSLSLPTLPLAPIKKELTLFTVFSIQIKVIYFFNVGHVVLSSSLLDFSCSTSGGINVKENIGRQV